MAEVVHLQGRIVQARRVDLNETVGYGAAFSVTSPARIATVAVGYADGFLRSSGGKGAAMLGGVRVPIVGRVSMDLITLDVTAVPEPAAQPGAAVSLIGGGISVDEVAANAGTIPYEILTSLGSRYRRVYRAAQPAAEPRTAAARS
jgi:alanine racemase